jgi:hypothetical protein
VEGKFPRKGKPGRSEVGTKNWPLVSNRNLDGAIAPVAGTRRNLSFLFNFFNTVWSGILPFQGRIFSLLTNRIEMQYIFSFWILKSKQVIEMAPFRNANLTQMIGSPQKIVMGKAFSI